jgi:opacity protein-like surface antigen
MKRTLAGFLGTGMLTLALVAPAQAQARGYVGFGGGLAIPMGSFGDAYKMGWLGQVIAGITGPNGMLGGRIDGMYIRHSFEGTVDGSTQMLGANGDLVVSPGSADAKIRPYLLGGIGFFNVKDEVGSVEGEGDTKFAYNIGAGLRFGAGSRMSFFVEGRYLNINTEGDSRGLIPIAIGVRWGGN